MNQLPQHLKERMEAEAKEWQRVCELNFAELRPLAVQDAFMNGVRKLYTALLEATPELKLKDVNWYGRPGSNGPYQEQVNEQYAKLAAQIAAKDARIAELQDDLNKSRAGLHLSSQRVAELEENVRFYRAEWESACERDRYGQEQIAARDEEIARLRDVCKLWVADWETVALQNCDKDEEIKRLREVLEFYAENLNHPLGEKARQALAKGDGDD